MPEQARFRVGLTNPQERDSILADYEAMDPKPVFTPWQVAVSEALRDGEAEKAIEAWHLRNRLHLCHDEEKTLTKLVDDWERHVRAQPGTSTVVLARTKAEGRALSWLMRQRVLSQTPEAKRAVIEVSRDLDGRLTEPLEVAVGDRIRIGATQWEKQLFNGTVVTVEGIEMHPEVRRDDDTAVSRKARNRQAAGRKNGKASAPESSRDESPVHITARTDDGRQVAYYAIAPKIVAAIPDGHAGWERIAAEVDAAVAAFAAGDEDGAFGIYVELVIRLKADWLGGGVVEVAASGDGGRP